MSEHPQQPVTAASPATPDGASPAAPKRSRGPGTLQLGIVVAILAAGILLTALTANVTQVSEPGIRLVGDQPFLPEKVGAWQGGPISGMTEEEKAVLPSDTELVRRLYTDPASNSIYCSVVLAGRDVTSIHRPELCLTGQGWQLDAAKTERVGVPTARGGVLQVTRMNARNSVTEKGHQMQAYAVFAYWFVGKDRTTPYHWQRILWTTEDRVLHNRNHRWAYFLINVMAAPEKTAQDPKAAQDEAMQTVRKFIQEFYPEEALN